MDTSGLRIGVILGSTRPRRRGESVAAWVMGQVGERDARYDLIDLRDHPLPLLDEPASASTGRYEHAHTQEWAATIARYDAFVIVCPEYNHGLPAALKNAVDYLWAEWLDKAAATVSYGNGGGQRSAEHLRNVLSAVGIAHVRPQVTLYNRDDFDGYTVTPNEHHLHGLEGMLGDLELWAAAMREVRAARES
ncbi:NADPH-dependent FMN reductase [Demequina mangrovi]|uniref:NAD(P)H-dependent FMN reductase n=1 Tax=Demequina mangrovi TaxID=1043493 RepID=A0A1H6W2W2_9MICO|nr:NAD(P)H-dependent oxidoreductase [Demequina mangrovi]SEJ11279.1 NAD(P)H-dependent FMN reductase [Demequina mangrovi]